MSTLPRTALAALVAVALLIPAPAAQVSATFPLLPDGVDGDSGLLRLRPAAGAIAAIAAATSAGEVVLTSLSLPGGAAVELELSRLALERLELGFQVDGQPAPGLLAGLDLSIFTGVVRDDPSSEVLLSFSQRGSRGWIRHQGEVHHLMPQPGAGGDWTASYVLLARESELGQRGVSLQADCALDRLPVARIPEVNPVVAPPGGSFSGSCSYWECPIAVETDFQLFSVFGDLGAEASYLTTLLAAVSARYEEEIDTVLTYPYVQFYTSPADPWTTPDIGGGSIDMLDEFVAAWTGDLPGGAILGHLVSGADLGGGVAYLGALCDSSQSFSFAVSGNIDGSVPFPVAVGPLNWDFMVFAHETGHNFNSPHTHDYSPQIDNCANGDCISNGTIMSYCHLCSGGLSNITTYFGAPAVIAVMQAHASACLPLFAPLVADAGSQPVLVAPGAGVPLTVEVQGSPVGPVNLDWRSDPLDPFVALPMAPLGGGLYGASLPGPACGDALEWSFSMVDATCGPWQTASFAAEVGVQDVLLSDDLEGASAWDPTAAGDDASSGIWAHGDPNGTGAQPEDDQTPSGSDCWFTGQGSVGGGLGENDVDGGTTTLTTAPIDLSSGDARIGYWRWYSNDAGSTPNTDVFVVQVSNGGAWVTVETVGPAGAGTSGGWIWSEFQVSDFVTPGAAVSLRFVASDLGSGSLVEAAVDGLRVFRVDCVGTCQDDLGWAGPGSAALTVCGGDLSTGTTADLEVTGATPGGTAFLVAGLVNAPTPIKGGVLVPVPWLLLLGVPLDGSGGLSLTLNGGGGPLTAFVQCVYADGAQPLGFGFSNAVAVDFLP